MMQTLCPRIDFDGEPEPDEETDKEDAGAVLFPVAAFRERARRGPRGRIVLMNGDVDEQSTAVGEVHAPDCPEER